jgi:hypothetical protein
LPFWIIARNTNNEITNLFGTNYICDIYLANRRYIKKVNFSKKISIRCRFHLDTEKNDLFGSHRYQFNRDLHSPCGVCGLLPCDVAVAWLHTTLAEIIPRPLGMFSVDDCGLSNVCQENIFRLVMWYDATIVIKNLNSLKLFYNCMLPSASY